MAKSKTSTPVNITDTAKPIDVIVKKPRISDTVIIAMITGVVSLISLFMTLKVNGKVDTVQTKVDTVHRQINSRMDELLKVSKELSREKGIQEGKAEEKADTKN